MPTGIEKATIATARRFRRNMTDGERKPWSELREFRRWCGIHFRRQAPVGRFIADFVAHDRRLVVEVDGEHHQPDQRSRDAARDLWLRKEGYAVLRFSTADLTESFDGCVEEILRELGVLPAPSAPSSPEGRDQS